MSPLVRTPDSVELNRIRPPFDAPPLDFDAAVRQLTPQLRRYATRRLNDAYEAEEVVHEALLRAYDHRDQFHSQDDLAAWSTCVAGRLAIDRIRVRNRSTLMAEVPEGTQAGRDTADVVVGKEQAMLALDSLDAMPTRQAAVLWAREVEGQPYIEIGDRFGMSEPAVRSTLCRVRKALRREFATRGGSLPSAGLLTISPWVDGLGWFERLRQSSVRLATAPSAVGMAAVSLFGGTLLTPWQTDTAKPPPAAIIYTVLAERPGLFSFAFGLLSTRPTTPPKAKKITAPTPATQAPVLSPVEAPTVVNAPSAPHVPRPTDVPPLAERLIDTSGLENICVRVTGTDLKVGGQHCDGQTQPTLLIGTDLPENPTGLKDVGVESNLLPCRDLAAGPVAQCRAVDKGHQ